jgi:hypothetical protein
MFYRASGASYQDGFAEASMRFLLTAVLLAAASFLIAASKPPDRLSHCPPEGDFKSLPAGIDLYSANRVWCWMKQQVNAPLGLPPPPVLVGPLRSDRYSAFIFPTPGAPDDQFSIEIASDTVQYEDPLFVVWALAHELAHSLFTLRPYGFSEQTIYPATVSSTHHCDPEFRRIAMGAADVLWDIYHSSQQRARMLSLDKEQFGRECSYQLNLTKASR